ncbi:hypothetical protein AGMMS49975_11220 [Clostridia bacterium]|nr:hypothetical protein AGMMS49975_11220 [Clostridia bacterium]
MSKFVYALLFAVFALFFQVKPIFAADMPVSVIMESDCAKKGGDLYLPLRDIGKNLGARVDWDNSTKAVTLSQGNTLRTPKIILENNKAMIKSTDLENIFDVDVKEYHSVVVVEKRGELAEARTIARVCAKSGGYAKEDADWLAKIVHAEARGEDYQSKLAVANVILNRTRYPYYPDTIKEVIFDKKSGVQFTPTINGAIYNEPSDDSYLAAAEALGGKNNAADALFFVNPAIAKSSWVSRNRNFIFAIGQHNFYS